MKSADFIIISFNNVDYKISISKLQTVFSVLENEKVIIKSEKQIRSLMKKYTLFDEGFLKNINKI